MFSNRLALAALGVTCVTAAGAGGYLATRHYAASPALDAALAAANQAGPTAGEPTPKADARLEPPRAKAAPGRRQAAEPRPSTLTTGPPAAPAVSSGTIAESPRFSPGVDQGSSAPNDIPDTAAPRIETPPPAAGTFIEVPVTPDPPATRAEELVVSADSVVGLRIDTTVTSDRARVEDRVEGRVTRDVSVGGTVAIPAGSRVLGSVLLVERGGRLKEVARLGIRFHTLLLADGTRLPISTETLYRSGEPPSNGSAAKIGGGAAAGAILGAIIGGAKGASIGGTVGAGAGTAAVMSREPSPATFRAGTDVTARILSPVTIVVEK